MNNQLENALDEAEDALVRLALVLNNQNLMFEAGEVDDLRARFTEIADDIAEVVG